MPPHAHVSALRVVPSEGTYTGVIRKHNVLMTLTASQMNEREREREISEWKSPMGVVIEAISSVGNQINC